MQVKHSYCLFGPRAVEKETMWTRKCENILILDFSKNEADIKDNENEVHKNCYGII